MMRSCIRPATYLFIFALLILTSCSSSGANSIVTSPTSVVDDELLSQLSDELDNKLDEFGTRHKPADAPGSFASQVLDFHISDASAEGVTYSWGYRNQGDYDQNGEVNTADLTPIALHFQANHASENWQAAEPVDGDGNAEVNIADISPIAANFRNVVNGYLMQSTTTPAVLSSWENLGHVTFSTGVMPEGGGFRQFSMLVASLPPATYIRVAPYHGDPEDAPLIGIGSNELQTASLEIPRDVTASQGDYASQIKLTWTYVEDATGYEIYRDQSDNLIETVGAVTQWIDTGVADLQEHRYWLKSVFPDGISDLSAWATGFLCRRGDWWMFGREQTHHFCSPILGPQSADIEWVYTAGEPFIFSSPAVAADGTIYAGTATDAISYLFAINPNGSLRWQFESPSWIQTSPAIANNGNIYFGSQDTFIALSPNGQQLWSYPINEFVFSSPAIGPDGTVYIGGEDTILYAINPTGSLKWGRPTSDKIMSSPAVAPNGLVYVGNEAGLMYAIDSIGDVVWTFPADDAIRSSPAVGDDGVIYFGSLSGTFYALNPTGKERWSFPASGLIFSSPAIAADGTVYVGTEGGDLIALNPSGTLKWRFLTQDSTWVDASPVIGGDGVIYFGGGDGKYYALNSDGTLLWDYQATGYFASGSALAGNGTLYATCNDGKIYAFGESQPVPPATPTGLTATDGELYQAIRLSWDMAYCVDSYAVFKDLGSDPVATVGGSMTSWVDTPVMDTDQHRYRIKAVNAYGASGLSDAAFGSAGNSPPGRGDWYMFGHDQAHTRISPITGPSSELLKWSIDLGTASYSSAAFGSGGELYIGVDSFDLYCVNPDGSVRWTFTAESAVGGSPAIGNDGTVYVGDFAGNMYAVNPDGTEKWSYPTGGVVYSSPNLGDDGIVYFGSADCSLYALNPNGTLEWKYDTAGEIWSSPAIGSDGTIYFGNNDNKVFGINPDGSLKWSADTTGEARCSPAVLWDLVLGDTVYFGCHDFKLYAFDADGNPLWDYTTEGVVFSSPAIGADGTVYFGSLDNYVYALNSDGSLKWRCNLFAAVYSSPALDANGTIWIGDSGGFINVITPGGLLDWYATTGAPVYDSSPAIGHDGTVFIADTDGWLYAYGTGS